MPRLPITEAPHPSGLDLERLTTRRLLARLHAGDVAAVRAVGSALEPLARLVDLVAARLGAGGRLFYAGAGTSGRLGALDAAECPPTFGVAPSRVQALVAGGARALRRAAEGAEDDAAAGAAAVRRARLGAADALVAITASGTTSFALAALEEARRRGAATALVTSNPAARARADVRVVLATGPELVAGSTRMKAGTATKMTLGLLSTAVFVRLGAVRAGRMAALRPGSAKLRARAIRNVAVLAEVSAARARALLERAGWDVPAVLGACLDSAPPLARRRYARDERSRSAGSGSRSRSARRRGDVR